MPVVSTQNAEHYVWGGGCDGWHLVRQPQLSVIQERVPPGSAEVRHYHERSHQFFFVLSGQATLEVGGEKIVLNAQEGLEVPPHISHQLLNESTSEVIFLVISQPPSHGDRIVDS